MALLVLGVSDWQVSLLAAVGGLTSAVLALPLGPAIEHRRKRPVMVAADLVRAAALVSVPLAAWSGRLTFAQLCAVSVLTTTGAIAFTAASGAHLKALVSEDQRATANSRFETTFWTATSVGPPLGGVLISWLGATTTMLVDAASFLGSAAGIRSLRSPEPAPPPRSADHPWARDITSGWRYVLAHPGLRALFVNAMLFGGALMLASPLQAVLMLRELGFTPWQYGLALGLPGLGGVAGAALMPRLVARYGQRRVLLTAGVTRTVWAAPVAAAPHGGWGVAVIVVSDFLLLFCAGVFNPTFVTYRMRETDDAYMARVGTAWSISARTVQPAFMLLGGLLASATSTRTAIAVAAALLATTGIFLPWRTHHR